MSHPGPWSTSVKELLGILQEALTAMVPIAERAHIHWRDGEAYDDWDGIAEALYRNIVVRTVDSALVTPFGDGMPRYDTHYSSYERSRFIVVEGDEIPRNVVAVFMGFAGVTSDFRLVKWRQLLAEGSAASAEVHLASFARCQFAVVQGTALDARTRDLVTIL